jgi:very-short-patch-repair endonuclease
MDGGAESPKETWLRLVLIDAGFPKPRTQIRVTDGTRVAFLDMGWDDVKIAVEYDGEHHRTDRGKYRDDILRAEMISRQGWIVVRVLAGDRPVDVVRRTTTAWLQRGIALSLRSGR